MTSFVSVLLVATYCPFANGPIAAVDNKCSDGKDPRKVELTILHAPDCDTMGDGCQFDHIAELRIDGLVVATIPVIDQGDAQNLANAARPIYERAK